MLRSLLLFVIISMGEARDQKYPYGWVNFGVKCYKFFPESVNWVTAERSCQSLGGNLASVHHVRQNSFLVSLVDSSARCWIGGHDGEQEGEWLWTDGSVHHYTNWCPREPNNQYTENCLEINWTSNRCWNDAPCSALKSYICAK